MIIKKQLSFLGLIFLQLVVSINPLDHQRSLVKLLATAPGLVAAYGFEEGSGNALNDQSGNANNGTLQNGPVWVTNGKFGKALRFDGNDDLVAVPDSNSLDLSTGMTLEAWVYPTSTMSSWDTILMKEYNSGLLYALYANGDGNLPSIYITNNHTEYGMSGGATLPLNTWIHVAATFDGSVIRLLLNGTQVKTLSFSGSIQTSTRGLGIGGNMVWRDEGFTGIIDEVRIYNRALTASEIASDMQTPVAGGNSTPASTATQTQAVTATRTPTSILTATQTSTSLVTATRTASPVFTATRTLTQVSTATRTFTPVFTATRTSTPAFTATLTQMSTVTRTPTSAFTPTATRTPTPLPQSMGPLRVSTTNPRYFANPNGTIIYLTGSHTWCNLMDCDDTNPIVASFNYTAYLDFLVAHNHNFFRLWRAENARGGEAGPNFWFSPLPYARSTTCCAFDGGNRFDLSQFNQAYFDRMRQRIIAARDRGIYVSVMLFDGWSVESKFGGHNPWDGHPYKLSNNINTVNGDTNNDNQGGETHTLVNSQITTLQEAYIRKVVDTVNDLDNVLYEISNESPGNSEAWQAHMITYVKNYEASKAKQHPVGMTVEYPNGSNTDLYNSPADWISPSGDLNNPPLANGSKVILSDTDHLCGICGSRQWVWKSFTRGENPLFMDPYDGAATGRGAPSGYDPNNSNDVSLRLNLGYARNYANRMNLAAMTPTNNTNLCSSGYCLRNAVASGAEYLAYLPSGGRITINLTATPGTLTVEWFNPSNGTTVNSGTVTGGANRQFTSPFGGDAVLYLKSTS